MSKGYVYVLSNEYMPDIVKVGRTTSDVEGRAQQLYQTGVPAPFNVEFSALVPDCEAAEREIHARLRESRISESREFFKADPKVAKDVLDEVRHEQVDEWLNEFFPDHSYVHSDVMVDPGDIGALAWKCGVADPLIATAIGLLTPEEIQPALDRWEQKRARWKAERERREAEGRNVASEVTE